VQVNFSDRCRGRGDLYVSFDWSIGVGKLEGTQIWLRSALLKHMSYLCQIAGVDQLREL